MPLAGHLAIRRLALGASLVLAASACADETKPDPEAESPAAASGASAEAASGSVAEAAPRGLPESGEAFLARIAPLPAPAIRIEYALRGAAGSTGDLELLMAPGGWRRETWTLAVPGGAGGSAIEMRGELIQTPDWVWRRVGSPGEEKDGSLEASLMASLRDAYLEAPVARREAIIAAIDEWQVALRRARSEHPGDRGELLGVDCLEMQLAGQRLCIWEEVGVPLRHDGAAFHLEAKTIERLDALPEAAFERPPGPESREIDTTALSDQPTPKEIFDQLVGGDPSGLAGILTPGLRIPDPELLAGDPPR